MSDAEFSQVREQGGFTAAPGRGAPGFGAMTGPLVLLGLLIALGVGLAVFLRHVRVRFVVDLAGGRAQAVRGDPPSAFVRGCTEVARVHRLSRGRILGIRSAEGIRLQFSPDIPKRVHQPLRNAWNAPGGGGPAGGRAAAG